MYLTILGNNGPFPAPNGACSSYLLELSLIHIFDSIG